MDTTWVVVADSSRARILEIPPRSREIHEIEDFVNPSGRAQSRELVTDAAGRSNLRASGAGNPMHGVFPSGDPVQHETELFAKRLCEVLDQARMQHRYEELYLVAAPKFLGLLRNNLSKEASKLVTREIDKDLSADDPASIYQRVTGHAVESPRPGGSRM
jgi:protein required for attachment to host cells